LSKAENISTTPNPPLSPKGNFFGIPLNGKALLKNAVGIEFATPASHKGMHQLLGIT
jgi:hypothetical protein